MATARFVLGVRGIIALAQGAVVDATLLLELAFRLAAKGRFVDVQRYGGGRLGVGGPLPSTGREAAAVPRLRGRPSQREAPQWCKARR